MYKRQSLFNIIGFSLLLLSSDIFILIIFLIFVCLGATFFGGLDPLIQATIGELNDPKTRSTAFAIGNLVIILGRSLSIFLLSISLGVFNNNYTPGFIALSILALICGIFLIPILRFLPDDLKNTA